MNRCASIRARQPGHSVQLSNRVTLATGVPLPILGKEKLLNGKTGEPFDQPVTVGVLHMLKLAHLVEDMVHARSTGRTAS